MTHSAGDTARVRRRAGRGIVRPPSPSPRPRTEEPVPRPDRRATVIAALIAVIVLAAGFSVVAAVRAGALHGGNRAVADAAPTSQVTDQVGAGLKAIFSYDYDNLPRTERAAASVLVDEAVGQYQAGYVPAKQQVLAQKLVRTTTVGSIAVADLRGDTAKLLVFVDQQTLTATSNQQSSASSALSVTARKVDGTWKIASLTAL